MKKFIIKIMPPPGGISRQEVRGKYHGHEKENFNYVISERQTLIRASCQKRKPEPDKRIGVPHPATGRGAKN